MANQAPDRITLEGSVARALEIARRRSGKTQEEMVRALSPYQSRPAKHQQRWHDWISRPGSVSSLALVAAARLANMTLDELLALATDAPASSPPPAVDLDDLIRSFDTRLSQIVDVVGRLQDTVETQGELLDRLAKQVLPARAGSPESEAAGHSPSIHRK